MKKMVTELQCLSMERDHSIFFSLSFFIQVNVRVLRLAAIAEWPSQEQGSGWPAHHRVAAQHQPAAAASSGSLGQGHEGVLRGQPLRVRRGLAGCLRCCTR